MKKLIIFFVFLIGLLPAAKADEQTGEQTIVKIGKHLTIYNYEDYGGSNYWGQKVVIKKTEITLPDDTYFQGLNIPEKEWAVFAQNQNGIYDTRLEKIAKEKAELRTDYNQLFANDTQKTNLVNSLEIILIASLVAICLLILAVLNLKQEIKKCINLKQEINQKSFENI